MERLLTVEFGPSRSKRFGQAVARAQGGPGECTEVGPGRYRVKFRLATDADAYSGLGRLLEWVRHWRATDVYEAEELVSTFHTKEMAWCASFYLSSFGECRQHFQYGVLPRCGFCPLFDAERAIRAGIREEPAPRLLIGDDADAFESDSGGYEIVFGPDLLEVLNWELPDWIDADFLFPDFLPEEWGEAAGEEPSD
jgi:hypothetical protein